MVKLTTSKIERGILYDYGLSLPPSWVSKWYCCFM